VSGFFWDPRKNEKLRLERGVTFEDVVQAIADGRLVAVLEQANPRKYPGQRVCVVEIRGYAHLVPFTEQVDRITLKTVIPSRKVTRRYLQGGKRHA